jgi:hypothetical protein
MISADNGLGEIVSARMGQGRHMSGIRLNRAWAGAALLLMTLSLGGCSISIGDLPLAGSSSDARAKDAGAYLPVNQVPPDRDEAAMNPAERAKIQNELVAARERQASAVAAKDQAQAKDQAPAQPQAGK